MWRPDDFLRRFMTFRILLVPFGSEGDVNPLFRFADGLVARGHEVVFLLSPHYGPLAERRGFPWHPVGTEENFRRFIQNPDLWDAQRGPRTVMQGMLASLPSYREAFKQIGTRFDLVVTSSFALAAASLAEAARIPRLTLHLQPICLRSTFDCPVFVPELAWLSRAPRWLKKAFFALVDWMFWNKIGRPLNAFRKELGLPPFGRFYGDAINGAHGVAALFPDWFAAPQPEWPANLRQFGFPVDPPSDSLPADLEHFLASGEPPVVWTHGSANLFVEDFQACALRVSWELGLRAVLVSLKPPTVPLPGQVFHCPHVRFEDLFPRCRAVVHHGGIGTTAKCIAAGLPQLIIPRAHDQPDNANRIVRLGLGDTLRYRQIASPEVSRRLQKLLESPSVAERCREFQKRMTSSDPIPSLCDWAEEIARSAR